MGMHIADKPYLETLVHMGELAHSAHHRHTELRARGEPCLQCTLRCYTDYCHVEDVHCIDCQLLVDHGRFKTLGPTICLAGTCATSRQRGSLNQFSHNRFISVPHI